MFKASSFLRIGYAVLASLVLLTGCNKEAEVASLTPVGFNNHDRCHICGMEILRYEGPKAEVYVKKIEEPVKFCSTRDAFTFALQPENQKRIAAIFVNDMGHADWEQADKAPLINAKDAFFVYGSDKEGVMGPEAIPFSDEDAAVRFQQEHGGQIVKLPDITLKLLSEQ